MLTGDWCPENDLVWQKEQAEIYKLSMEKENEKLRARLVEAEKQIDSLKKALHNIVSIEKTTIKLKDSWCPAARNAVRLAKEAIQCKI